VCVFKVTHTLMLFAKWYLAAKCGIQLEKKCEISYFSLSRRMTRCDAAPVRKLFSCAN